MAQVRTAHTKPRTPAPSGRADIGSVAAGSTRQVLFADEPGVRSQCAWYRPYMAGASIWHPCTHMHAYTRDSARVICTDDDVYVMVTHMHVYTRERARERENGEGHWQGMHTHERERVRERTERGREGKRKGANKVVALHICIHTYTIE